MSIKKKWPNFKTHPHSLERSHCAHWKLKMLSLPYLDVDIRLPFSSRRIIDVHRSKTKTIYIPLTNKCLFMEAIYFFFLHGFVWALWVPCGIWWHIYVCSFVSGVLKVLPHSYQTVWNSSLSVSVHTHKIGFEFPPWLKFPGQ